MGMHPVSKLKSELQLRWIVRQDLPEVLRIETESFEFAWREEDFVQCLRQRNCVGMVAEYEGQVVGYMIYELFPSTIHLMNFAIHPSVRRTGVGTQLVNRLINKLQQQRRDRIVLEVRETNLGAQLFFQKMGLRATEVLRDYYEDSDESAYRMQIEIEPRFSQTDVRNRISNVFEAE